MDRDAIERRDFPVGRRGYDAAAVDEHLRRVADEIESLRTDATPATPLSAGASEQVRAILAAAETGAAELRAQAGREAGDHVARVEQAAAVMLARLDQVEGELNELLGALRRSGDRLTEGLAELQREVGGIGGPPAAEARAKDAAPHLDGDEAGARLIALNMALSGTPREETSRYLAEHFRLPDADGLLADVYERAGR